MDNCLAKKLVPYIRNLLGNTQLSYFGQTLREGAHYSNKAVQFLNDTNIKFVLESQWPRVVPSEAMMQWDHPRTMERHREPCMAQVCFVCLKLYA